MPFQRVEGDILVDNYTVVAHVANSISTVAKGFTAVLFASYPHADIYSRRGDQTPPLRDPPGQVIARGDGQTQRYIAHLIASIYPGPPKWKNDSAEKRQAWFQEALNHLAQFPLFHYPETTLAFPAGLGGSDLSESFESILESWARQLPCRVFLVRWEGASANATTLAANPVQ